MSNKANKSDDKLNSNLSNDEATEFMRQAMHGLRSAIVNNDINEAKNIETELNKHFKELWGLGDDIYEIVTCCDFAYDVRATLENKGGTATLLDSYDRMFNPSSDKFGDPAPDNVIHSSGAYTGPEA